MSKYAREGVLGNFAVIRRRSSEETPFILPLHAVGVDVMSETTVVIL